MRRRPDLLTLQPPRLDGSTWPDRRAVGRHSFDMAALYEIGYREAFEPDAHEIAELLVDEVLVLIPIVAAPDDEPYLRRTLLVAAQVGAGIGIVEARSTALDLACTERRIWGALWHALSELPSLAPADRYVAAYMMQAGHYVARVGVAAIPALRAALEGDAG